MVAIVGIAVVVGALVAWPEPGEPAVATATPGPDPSSATAATPTAATPTAAALSRELAHLLPDPTVRICTLVGRVVDTSGRGLPDAVVHAYGANADATPTTAARHDARPACAVAGDAEGRFRLPIPDTLDGAVVVVGARAPGHRLGWIEWPITEAGAERQIVLEPGLQLSGTVRDDQGRPVAVPLLCTTDNRMGQDATLVSAWLLDRTAFRTPPPTWDGCEVESSSSADGTFCFTGLRPGSFHIASAAPDWFVQPAVEVVAGSSAIDVVVVPRPAIELRLVDDATGEPVADPELNVAVTRVEERQGAQARYRRAGRGRNGVVSLAWYDEPTWSKLKLVCTVSAPEHDEKTVALELEPGSLRAKTEVRMHRRSRDMRAVFVRAVTAGGRPLAEPCAIQFRKSGDLHWQLLGSRSVTNGQFVDVPVAPGALQVGVVDGLACSVTWEGSWKPADNVESITVDLPAHGTIELRLKDDVSRPYLLHLRRPGVDYTTSRSVSELKIPGLAVGDWEVEVTSKSGSCTRTVSVHDGVSQTVIATHR